MHGRSVKISIQKVSTITLFRVLRCWPLFFFDNVEQKRVMKYLTKNSHSVGSGDAPAPRHPVGSRDVRAAAERESFLLANLSRLIKKLTRTTSAPLLYKLGHRLSTKSQAQDFKKYVVMI